MTGGGGGAGERKRACSGVFGAGWDGGRAAVLVKWWREVGGRMDKHVVGGDVWQSTGWRGARGWRSVTVVNQPGRRHG